jgi:hypothetical protein
VGLMIGSLSKRRAPQPSPGRPARDAANSYSILI